MQRKSSFAAFIIPIIVAICLLIVFILFVCAPNLEPFTLFKAPLPLTILKESFGEPKKFQAPMSLTYVKSETNVRGQKNYTTYIHELIEKYNKKRSKETMKKTINEVLNDIAHHDIVGFHKHHLERDVRKLHLHYEQGNILTMPTFFDSRDKWPGCLPPSAFQGTCGSCWAFAICTCLSARFYIESCGYGGCTGYPQMNQRSLNLGMDNINELYNFRQITITNIHNFINTDSDKEVVSKKEWIDAARRAHNNVINKTGYDRFYSMQVLVYMLDYQSLGSIKFTKKDPNWDAIEARAARVFNDWKGPSGDINVREWKDQWLYQPISLSIEKLISCCYPNCFESSSKTIGKTREDIIKKGTPQCLGNSLIDGWKLARDVGVPTSMCIGYNLDNWQEGDPTPNCHELQGPNYEYCSGFSLSIDGWNKTVEDQLDINEKNFTNPINANNKDLGALPWSSQQIFKFVAKNAYEVKSEMHIIQREILERGPVTTGFTIYPDFQNKFGTLGLGGQKFKGEPLGSGENSLIYIWDGQGESIGGHAITIVGWGTYADVEQKLNIPYWICLNSWGRDWGTNGYPTSDNRTGPPSKLNGGGYFWMVRGIDNCGIESNVCSGQPDLANITYPGVMEKYGWGLPFPDLDTVRLISNIDKKKLRDSGLDIEFGDFWPGGGLYNFNYGNDKWELTGMEPPSPYVLFWPMERPLYCIGKILNELGPNDTSILVDESTYNILVEIGTKLFNPVIVMGKEQIQILTRANLTKSSFSVLRGVNRSHVSKHMAGTDIKIYPYKTISMEYLSKYPRCPLVYDGVTVETETIESLCGPRLYQKKILNQ
jgi:hypothetical protein